MNIKSHCEIVLFCKKIYITTMSGYVAIQKSSTQQMNASVGINLLKCSKNFKKIIDGSKQWSIKPWYKNFSNYILQFYGKLFD